MNLAEIKKHWASYKAHRLLRFLRDGKTVYKELDGKPLRNLAGTNAQVVNYKDYFGFPAYLERYVMPVLLTRARKGKAEKYGGKK